MREIILENLCRLCLSDCFPCSNIFIDCSSSGHVIFEVLKFVYNLEASQDDDLPANICRPCLWKLIEFETYKRNVHNRKSELRILVGKLVSKNRARLEEEVGGATVDKEESWDLVKEPRDSDDNFCDSEDIQCTSLVNEVFIKQERVEYEDERDENHPEDAPELTVAPNKNAISNYKVRETSESHFIAKDAPKVSESAPIFSSLSNSSVASEFSEEAEPLLANNLCEVESETDVSRSPKMKSSGEVISAKDLKGMKKTFEDPLKIVNYSPFQSLSIPFRDKENVYVCSVCDESFECKEELGRHVVFHYNDRPFPSAISDGYYKRNFEINQNWYKHAKEEALINRNWDGNQCRENFICETCGKEYDDKKKLDMHLIRHTNKFSCSFCGKCFGGNRERERHIRIHTQEKPFHCSICKKSFNRKDNLRTHMTTHFGQKPSSFQRNARSVRLKKRS